MAPPKKPRLRHRVEYAAGRAILAVFGVLPFRAARAGGRVLGLLGYWLGVRRVVVERQVAAAFPDVRLQEVIVDAMAARLVRELESKGDAEAQAITSAAKKMFSPTIGRSPFHLFVL